MYIHIANLQNVYWTIKETVTELLQTQIPLSCADAIRFIKLVNTLLNHLYTESYLQCIHNSRYYMRSKPIWLHDIQDQTILHCKYT